MNEISPQQLAGLRRALLAVTAVHDSLRDGDAPGVMCSYTASARVDLENAISHARALTETPGGAR